MKNLDRFALILVLIGALNWGFVALFNIDAVELLFGAAPVASKAIYGIIALAGVYEIVGYRAIHHRWHLRHPAS